MSSPLRVTVTGAAGQIGYALVFRIASGQMFGSNQSVILQLLDVTQAQSALHGIMMELDDCAFPLLAGMSATDNPMIGFKDADIALLMGSSPRKQGMERRDLFAHNAHIFREQGKALNAVAARNVKVLVVGNPANTNAYIAMRSAPDLPRENFTALLRLDHNRAVSMLAKTAGCAVQSIDKLIVWGNHSPTMYPDIRYVTVEGRPLKEFCPTIDQQWNTATFIPTVAQRGTAIIQARGSSSAASAANAIVDHMRDWVFGSKGKWVTMGVPSNGAYAVPEGIVCGFPVQIDSGQYKIVEGLEIDAFSEKYMAKTLGELVDESQESNAYINID